MNYRETGNKIPISTQELSNYVYKQLALYDEQIKTTKILPNYNPYTQPIIYKTKAGKSIRIPEEIQKNAINDWYTRTGTNIPIMQRQTSEVEQELEIEINEDIPETTNGIIAQSNSNAHNYNVISIGILIFAAILAIYLFYKIGNDTNSIQKIPQTRYYLTR